MAGTSEHHLPTASSSQQDPPQHASRVTSHSASFYNDPSSHVTLPEPLADEANPHPAPHLYPISSEPSTHYSPTTSERPPSHLHNHLFSHDFSPLEPPHARFQRSSQTPQPPQRATSSSYPTIYAPPHPSASKQDMPYVHEPPPTAQPEISPVGHYPHPI